MSRNVFLPSFIILLFGGFIISQNLKIGDAVGSPILWPDSRYNKDVGSINSNYDRIGTDVLQAYFSGEEEIMLNPDLYHQSEAFDRYIYERVLPATPASSLTPIIKNINMVLWEGDPSYQLLPDTTSEVGFNIYMFRSNGEPGDFAAYTNPEWNIGKLSIFTSEHSSETVNELMKFGNEFIDNYSFITHGGNISTTGCTGTHYYRNLRNILSRHIRLIKKDATKVLSIWEYIILAR